MYNEINLQDILSVHWKMGGKSMKKKNIAWLLSAAVILTTAATPLEIMPVYAAEEFQADETEEAGTEEAETKEGE